MTLYAVTFVLFVNKQTVIIKAFDYAKSLIEVCERIWVPLLNLKNSRFFTFSALNASFLSTQGNKKRTSKRMSSFYWRLFDLLCKSPSCSGSYWKAGETGDAPPVAEEVSLFRGSGAVCGFQKATNSNAATVFTRPRFPLQIFLSLRAAEDFISFLGHIRQSK